MDKSELMRSMVHVRFTETERRKMKAICALRGTSMQEYIRALVLKGLEKQKGKTKL